MKKNQIAVAIVIIFTLLTGYLIAGSLVVWYHDYQLKEAFSTVNGRITVLQNEI
ncbi:hypothetical protein AALB16_05055 [Lachnospiraceae bacterium 62-35]